MPSTSVSVPGKVMLSGEYAVLHGGTAVLVPVEERRMVLHPTGSGAPEDAPTPVVREALSLEIEECARYEDVNGLPRIELDSSRFHVEGPLGERRKLGLGGSAAEAVGTVALRLMLAGEDWTAMRPRVAELADRAHRRAQGGAGSGADVYAIAYGEPIRFRREEGRAAVRPLARAHPESLPMTLVWTGNSANTRELVARFEEWAQSGSFADAAVAALVEASHEFADAWEKGSRTEILAAWDDFFARMGMCAEAAGLPWRTQAHEELEAWAMGHGGRAKPTGAGGGDLSLLFGVLPTSDDIERLMLPLREF